jgi:hypothetical protein
VAIAETNFTVTAQGSEQGYMDMFEGGLQEVEMAITGNAV